MKYLLIAAILGGCATPTPTALPPCSGVEVIVLGDEAPGCNLTPPQTLSYRLLDLDDPALETANQDCLDAGGTPEWRDTSLTCRNTDY